MNNKKQHHFDKLQKSSILFMQLGLVLALLIVYLAFEFTSVKENILPSRVTPDDEIVFVEYDIPINYAKKKNKVKKQSIVKKLAPIIDIKTEPDDTPAEQQVIDPPIEYVPTTKAINSIVEAPNKIDDGEPLPFIIIEEAPIFPGCEGLDSLASRQCFTEKISTFVNKKFDTSLAVRINSTGIQRIWVQFTIDKNGNVADIVADSPHKSLEKEAVRIVQKLPHMIPGKQRKRPVAVKYTLPISFFIE